MHTYEQILDTIKKNMVAVMDDFDASKVDPNKSMKDYNADSLEMVEIVSRTMKQLQIKAPRTELMRVTNIDGLAKLLEEYSKNDAQAQ